MTPPDPSQPGLTQTRALHGGPPNAGGYRQLLIGAGAPHVLRRDLAQPGAPGEVLLSVAHLSDVHVCDAQSPARAEFLDRWADPDSPILADVGEVGAYRAQEMLTMQVADATVRAVNAVRAGPVGGAPLDLAIATGDNIDNAQANELACYLALLDGGLVRPDSGDLTRYEGVADSTAADERFWHPDAPSIDLPRSRFGFPTVPGLLDAVRAPFVADGLALPWLAVHGNHDRMLQGTLPAIGALADEMTRADKPIALPDGLSDREILQLLQGIAACDPAAMATLAHAQRRTVTADVGRRAISRAEFVRAHLTASARPDGHGFGRDLLPHYRHDHGSVTMLVLDTVDQYGGWQGSLDRAQLAWLAAELVQADAERRYVVLASHHPLSTLVNDTTGPDGEPRVLGSEVAALLAEHPSVVLWLNGHTHATTITAHGTWWELTAPSLIDWPQQARIVELLRGGGVLSIAATMLDHAGTAPWDGRTDSTTALAGLSRELAANDWQWRCTPLERHPRAGTVRDRNVLLPLRDPWA